MSHGQNVLSVAFHKIENCGIKCFFYLRLNHSKDKCWKKLKDGKSHSGTIIVFGSIVE
jgi:hypothetical protein